MLGTRIETEAIRVLLMTMLVHDKTTSDLPGKPYCAPHDLLASVVSRPAHPGEPQVF